MPASKLTGKRGSITIDSTAIPFKVIGATIDKELKDGTDSDDYVLETDSIYNSEFFGKTSAELSIEFNFDLNSTGTEILDRMESDDAFATVVRVNPDTIVFDGDCIVSNVQYTIDYNEMVSGTATLRNRGRFWHGARA